MIEYVANPPRCSFAFQEAWNIATFSSKETPDSDWGVIDILHDPPQRITSLISACDERCVRLKAGDLMVAKG